MSFIRTLATLAVGFAAAKGLDKLNKAGGLKGLAAKMSNPAETEGLSRQVGQMLEKVGVSGGEQKVQEALARMGGATAAGTEAASAGMTRLMSALGGAAAAGATATAGVVDALTGGGANAAVEAQAKLMIRAMIEAAKADGEIDPVERARILEVMGDADPEGRAWVEEMLSSPPDMAGLVADTDEETRAQVYAVSLAAITVDNEAEETYLRRLAEALRLPAETVAQIRGQA